MTTEGPGGDVRTAEQAGLRIPGPRRSQDTRDRLIDAAVAITSSEGWSAVTMSRLAEVAGVSRQTVYNGIGTRRELAEAMILRELERFLGCVTHAFEDHDELLPAIDAATSAVLERASDNQLLHAIVSATHGADTELLPYLTGHSHGLFGFARELIRVNLDRFELDLDEHQKTVAIDTVVRVVLSHVMQPSASPAEAAADIAWVAGRVLRLPESEG